MKKMTKLFLIITLITAICLGNAPIYASASEPLSVTPRWSNANSITADFSASSSGGDVFINYTGYKDSFANAVVSVKLQKKFLLFFWTDVDEWSATSTNCSDILTHTFSLNGTGTYKAIFTVEIFGINGNVDTYTTEIESKYSN